MLNKIFDVFSKYQCFQTSGFETSQSRCLWLFIKLKPKFISSKFQEHYQTHPYIFSGHPRQRYPRSTLSLPPSAPSSHRIRCGDKRRLRSSLLSFHPSNHLRFLWFRPTLISRCSFIYFHYDLLFDWILQLSSLFDLSLLCIHPAHPVFAPSWIHLLLYFHVGIVWIFRWVYVDKNQ